MRHKHILSIAIVFILATAGMIAQEYSGVDRLQNLWLNQEMRVQGKLLFALPQDQNLFVVEYLADKEKNLLGKWALDLSQIKLK